MLDNTKRLTPDFLDAVKTYIDRNYDPNAGKVLHQVTSFGVAAALHGMLESVLGRAQDAGRVNIPDVDKMLQNSDETWSTTLMHLIDAKDEKDTTIYRRAHVDRKHFSKIRSDENYKPKKQTAIAFALALRLTLDETQEFLSRAGYCLTRSSKSDIVVEYFIVKKLYDIDYLNATLEHFDQPPLVG